MGVDEGDGREVGDSGCKGVGSGSCEDVGSGSCEEVGCSRGVAPSLLAIVGGTVAL